MVLKNVTNEKIELPWGGYNYTLLPGEAKDFPSNVGKALSVRLKDKVQSVDAPCDADVVEAPVEKEEVKEVPPTRATFPRKPKNK